MSARTPSRRRTSAVSLPIAAVGYAAPPPAYVPYPYPYPYPMFPPPPAKTAAGIARLRWAVVLGAAMHTINIPSFLWFAYLLSTLTNPPGFGGGFEIIAAALAFQCAAGLVGFIGAVFFLLGAYECHEGRDEHGPDHARDMDRALVFVIIAFVMGVVASAGGIGFLGGAFGLGYPFNPLSGAFGAVRGLFVGLVLVSVVKAFLPKEDRDLGWAATVLLTAAPAAGGGASLLFLAAGSPTGPFEPPAFLELAFALAAGLAVVELVAYVLFFRMYSKVHRRMRAGEFPPVPRPPVLYAPYYPAPGYYPPYPSYPVDPTAPSTPPAEPPPGPPP